MRVQIAIVIAGFLLLLGGAPLLAATSDPRTVMEDSLAKITTILTDPASDNESLWPEKKKKVIAIIEENFDFEEMSKRCLAKAWRKRSGVEKEYFVEIFQELLQNTYIDRLKTVSDEKITVGAVRTRGKKAVVKTVVLHNRKDYSFVYKMRLKNDKWYVYDVIIEGVSLISNYRSQFSQVINKDGYPALVARIEEKIQPEEIEEYAN